MELRKKIKNQYIEGVILDVDVGFGMKYKDPNNIYLKLVIQQYDGYECTQLFRINRLNDLLNMYSISYSDESTIKQLIHQKVFLLTSEQTDGVPDAISKVPPTDKKFTEWFRNDNWS